MADNQNQTGDQTQPVMTGGFKGRLTARKRRRLLIIAVAVIIALAAGFSYLVYRQLNPLGSQQPTYDLSGFPGDVDLMTTAQMDIYLKAKTGFSLDQIEHWSTGDIKKSKFKDFDEAYIVAQAYAALKTYDQQAYAAYQAADQLDGDHDATFYKDYANAAAQVQNGQVYREALGKAGEAVKRDNSLSAKDKKDQIDEINLLIKISQGAF
ncbi:MAG TPA: hypothetical protein VFL81_00080 [Candidatus Saccharimonadales bacterium]|nr:hypothetical protein [Candidatus Saccharimonadales bacterium]